ncbi:IS66 family insertion sequence element accessory protein TnpB [Pseudoalteromonas nigrifaciens]|uniref:IS66 family insertion sequence element accessory protein TnpB n=1 Tax=Pseudoalteromonas nigrifaciens TaxID=28109 RepID=UPI00384E0110
MFCKKAKDKLKLVCWDKTGFALWYKRLGETRSRFIYCWTLIYPFVLPKVSYFDMHH